MSHRRQLSGHCVDADANVSADMVRWWFNDFIQTSEHYKWWHPTDHAWMDWENKKPGEIYAASHLVHEYFGGQMAKLRIQFASPDEFFGRDPNDEKHLCCAPGWGFWMRR